MLSVFRYDIVRRSMTQSRSKIPGVVCVLMWEKSGNIGGEHTEADRSIAGA
jgi:hypothetical protein